MKYILLFLIICSQFVLSQDEENNYVVEFVTTKQGLSHNYVTGIVSDDLNIKWIGTENGITKFNGFDFEYIKPGENFTELLNENVEAPLFIDKDSNLWIGTKSGGIACLDIKHNTVKNYNNILRQHMSGDLRVTAISQDINGYIWVGTWSDGVFVIDHKNGKLIDYHPFNQIVYTIVKDFNNNIWFCAGNRLYLYDHFNKKLKQHLIQGQISDILPDAKRNKLWITLAGKNQQLFSYNYSTTEIEVMDTDVESSFSRKLMLDNYNRLWIGTWGNGVYRSDENVTNFKKVDLTGASPDKVAGNYDTVIYIHQDENNIIWLATTNGGVVKLVEGNGFKNANELIQDPYLKTHLNCTSLYKNDRQIFVGTNNGLFYGDNFESLKPVKGIANIRIMAIYPYKNQLFIGTGGSFYIYDLTEEKVIFESADIGKITTFFIENNRIYIGTQQRGLAVGDLDNLEDINSFTFFSERLQDNRKIRSNRITSIKKDNQNNLWISTYNGLHKWDETQNRFIHQSELLENSQSIIIINQLLIKDNLLWLATPNGLFKLEHGQNKLKTLEVLTQKNGLNSDFICALTFDNQENLWFSTHTEIVKYNTKNKDLRSHAFINGVKTTSFNNRSFQNYQNETIYFGGIDNITYFNPSGIKYFNVVPEVVFTNLRVNNELIQFNPGNTILDDNFNYASNIKLTHQQNFFSTSFVANDFLGELNTKYKYQLEGYQKQWIDLQNRNEINFAGLAPGNYTLKVKATRDNQNWSEAKALNITILSSPWLSPLAIFVYLLIISTIIYYLIKTNNYQLKLKNNLEIARIDKEKEVELTEAKLTFFTNISHEFRTPLTLIITPLKELLDDDSLPPKVVKNLSYIDRNTNRLLNLINQLLDFRKADRGLLKLDVSHGNFVRFSREVHLYFKEAAKAKNIQYKFKAKQDEITFPFDRNKMEIVLCNLLSNALKYTKPGDKIGMKISSDNNYCIISIKDSGIGMKDEDLEKIFDRFFQIKSGSTAHLIGSGIGLSFSKRIVELHHGSISVKSKPNVGTEFIVKLSMNPQLYEGIINENFVTTDNMKAYESLEIESPIDNLNINAKEHSVLIIDDNVEILSYLKGILSDNYNIVEATNGDEGFEIASTEIPDLILSDVMMPGKDGITLCKELKSQIITSHIPIILLTARTSTVFEIEGLKTGADDYVTKPFNAKVIKARIASLLENREKLRSHLLNKVRFEPTSNNTDTEDTENAFINKAILLVEENIDNEAFGIESMVDSLNMSQSTLYRKIKSLTGLSLTAFIRSVRLKKAAYLILTTDLNLNEIAYDVGFNDYKYFKSSFKKQFNCLPSKYKEIIQEQR